MCQCVSLFSNTFNFKIDNQIVLWNQQVIGNRSLCMIEVASASINNAQRHTFRVCLERLICILEIEKTTTKDYILRSSAAGAFSFTCYIEIMLKETATY